MARRFIDTELFDDEWFMDLSKDSKILYIYLITKCSHAGLIKINERLCKVQTGITDLKGALKGLERALIGPNEGLYFLPKFLYWQYPKFPQSKVYQQKAALDELTKYGLFIDGKLAPNEGLWRPYVDVDVNADVNENENVDVIYPFDSENFMKWWVLWKDYKKKEHKFQYKSIVSEQGALKELSKLSNGNEAMALQIIEQSISNGWKGFFELKQGTKKYNSDPIAREIMREKIGAEIEKKWKK